ncbi:hypothetical protein AWR36_008740 [Microbulbifer flavimaris]|uniref:Aminoglycoside phosphotransferase domain-containing protein n=1 Tax=Microbulbifer flavimaris TaxID=1781068 RepID=A0ABX4I0X8_9GAMM|nr:MULTISPECIES: choline/ethanolamine kinase family protein [Microbulbifer]KUJ83887.1 hypothetical protein AVO43_08705 [Microbulbifer sp. ZGT114]PCO06065.1 hypothetical protein AWR36_008740 [Microbulbifer flavimaris]
MTRNLRDIIPGDWSLWSDTEPRVIKPLDGGLTNQSYLLASSQGQLVLRRNSAISRALDLNRSAEADALRHADAAGLCAPLIHCDPLRQYLVTRYIEGVSWRSEEPTALQRLAALLRGIHALPAIDTRLNIEEKIEAYWQSVNSQSGFYPALSALDKVVRKHIDQARALSEGDSLCHNDLSRGNLICTAAERVYALDWEYAAMGDPFYELAVIIEEHKMGEPQQECLLADYLQRPVAASDWRRLQHWRVIYEYLSVLWYAVQFSTGAMADPNVREEIFRRVRQLSVNGSMPNG